MSLLALNHLMVAFTSAITNTVGDNVMMQKAI